MFELCFFVLGQSLTDLSQSLKSLKVKNGSKVMLIGKKVSLVWILSNFHLGVKKLIICDYFDVAAFRCEFFVKHLCQIQYKMKSHCDLVTVLLICKLTVPTPN